jgi:hypothetical protein
MKKKVLVNFIMIGIMFVILGILQKLLMPKYMSQIHEGNLIQEYYKETTDHEVIFLGDCEVFANISPITLWEKYGITSYIRGSAQQLIWQSYYLLKETLRREKPKVVVYNVLAMKYNEPQKEAYNRLTLDGMQLSGAKIGAIGASMEKGENLMTYLFPILRYHARWSALTGEDFKYLFHRDKISHNGYLMRVDVKPAGFIPKASKLPDYQFGKNSYHYLNLMTKLCKENGIKLILIKSPSLYPYWYQEWDEQMVRYAKANDLTYINFLKRSKEMGINYKKDTYDGGLHLNLSGAEKFSSYFGDYLSRTFYLQDMRKNSAYQKVWDGKIKFYDTMEENQKKELKEYGYLKSYGALKPAN